MSGFKDRRVSLRQLAKAMQGGLNSCANVGKEVEVGRRTRLLPRLGLHDWRGTAVLTLLLMLGGCSRFSNAPDIGEPLPPLEVPELAPVQGNGAIFQSHQGFLPLFEDRRPRRVGDTLTIVLNEQVNAVRNSNTSASRSGSANLNLEQLPDILDVLADYGFEISGNNTFNGSGGARATNTFTGVIAVAVRQIMPNGNLLVMGEKQVVINQGTEYIRFVGVVNPRTITTANTVPSTEVADARIEYSGDSYAARAQRMGWMQRLFLSVSPY